VECVEVAIWMAHGPTAALPWLRAAG
jgi:hypothetical protein